MYRKQGHKRSSGRIPVVLPVHWRRPDGDVTMLQTENISAGGMLLRSSHFVPPDRQIELVLDLPGSDRELHATAQARFVGPAEDGYAIGVQITAMEPADWTEWQRWCTRLSPSIAAAERTSDGLRSIRSNAHILLVASALPEEMLAVLVAHGYHVHVVRDSLEALGTLRQRHDFEIVICEVRRKDLDGRALCDQVKQDRSLRDVHVLLVADGDARQDLLDGLAAGATYVVARPFTEDFFLSLIALCQRG